MMKGFQHFCYKTKLCLKRGSPTILTCLAGIGVVTTAVMSTKATIKAVELLEDAKKEKGDELTTIEKVRIAGSEYIPTAIVCACTITCLFGANVLNKKQQASMASAYALVRESFNNYRNAAIKVYGKEGDARIKSEMAKEAYVHADGYQLYFPDQDSGEKVLFFDTYSNRYFNSTISSVINAQYHVNRNLQLRGYVPLNEFYEFIGLSKIDGGYDIGWNMDNIMESGFMWLDFDNLYSKINGDFECYIISAAFDPELVQ